MKREREREKTEKQRNIFMAKNGWRGEKARKPSSGRQARTSLRKRKPKASAATFAKRADGTPTPPTN